jgi:hypothetical protein
MSQVGTGIPKKILTRLKAACKMRLNACKKQNKTTITITNLERKLSPNIGRNPSLILQQLQQLIFWTPKRQKLS